MNPNSEINSEHSAETQAVGTTPTASAAAYREALKAVIDPEIFQNIVDLGLIYAVDVAPHSPADTSAEQADDNSDTHTEATAGDQVTVTMTLTSPHCPLGPQIMQDVEQTVLQAGASAVQVDLVWQPPWTPDAMTDELKRELGVGAEEEEPTLPIDPPPPPPPKKKGWFNRLFGG